MDLERQAKSDHKLPCLPPVGSGKKSMNIKQRREMS